MSLSVKEILERLVVTSPTPPSLDQTRYSCSEYLILPYLKERRRSIVRITGDLLRSCVTPNWTCIVPALAHPKLFVSFSNFVQYAHSYATQTYSNITINWQEEVRIPREFKNLASFKLPWFDSRHFLLQHGRYSHLVSLFSGSNGPRYGYHYPIHLGVQSIRVWPG